MEKTRIDKLVGINVKKPVLQVKHSELTRAQDDSEYKSICPACNEGWLLVHRDMETMKLRSHDNCILCGQHVEYTDIPDNKYMFFEEMKEVN